MRANFLAQDQPHLQYSAKEIAKQDENISTRERDFKAGACMSLWSLEKDDLPQVRNIMAAFGLYPRTGVHDICN